MRTLMVMAVLCLVPLTAAAQCGYEGTARRLTPQFVADYDFDYEPPTRPRQTPQYFDGPSRQRPAERAPFERGPFDESIERLAQPRINVVINNGRGSDHGSVRGNDAELSYRAADLQTVLVEASTRQELLLQAEQAGVASRFERRFLDGLGLDDENELLVRLQTAAVLAKRGVKVGH